jgi:hypothetical protein
VGSALKNVIFFFASTVRPVATFTETLNKMQNI